MFILFILILNYKNKSLKMILYKINSFPLLHQNIRIMKTISFFIMATLGLSCESVYLSFLSACVCIILIAKSK